MRFTKMQGLGNDYVYVDCINQPPPRHPAELSKALSDRHFGVGADGLILICPSERADARMRMFNADGSEAEMCGNGLRCFGKYLHDHGIARKPTLTVETGRGVLTLDVETEKGKAVRLKVNMGEPILEAERIPALFPGPRVVDQPWSFLTPPGQAPGEEFYAAWEKQPWYLECGLDPRITCVSMGNPHVVLYCTDVARVPLQEVGPLLETAACFPKRINVHFVQVHRPERATMRTWERGSGITLACGTGACAVCVAGVLTGRTRRQLLAHLPGGDLRLEWSEADNHVYKTGPAVEVFCGDWPTE